MTTYTARSFEKAQLAHHPDGRVAARINDHEYPWAGLNVGGARENFGDGEMARKGWVPVQQCPNPDQHDDRYVSPLAVSRVQEVQVRLEQAEQERDEANDALAEYVKARVARDPLTAREHLDAAWEAARVVPAGTAIAPGVGYITRYEGSGEILASVEGHSAILPTRGIWGERRLLDPPDPSRPEGAEEIEAWLDGMPESIRLDGDEHQRLFANHLAHMGFRIPAVMEEGR